MDNDRFQFQFTRLLSMVAAVFVIAAIPRQVVCAVLPELTTISSVRALKPDQANSARPVRLRGVVTVLSGWKSSFFFHDGTSGISVDRTNDSPELESGELVEIRGVTGPGLFAPIVIANNVTVLGKGKLPAARLFNSTDLVGGKEDSQWIAVRGIVRSAVVKPSWGRSVLFLDIDIGGGNIVVARVHDFSQARFDLLPAATVTVRGVCGTVFNDKRQFVGLRLFVASQNDVKIELPAPTEPFDIPLRPLGSLLQFEDRQGSINRIKIQGVVTYSKPGQGLYIQDGTQGIFVQSGQSTPVVVGSQIEAVGYPAVGRYSPKLDNAVFRVAGTARPVNPLAQTAASMIVMNDGFSSAPYDSVLVQVKGRLIEEVPGTEEDLLLLQDGTSVFTAKVSRSGQNRRSIVTGSLVSVTGVCAANADEAHEVRSFEILLRSRADLVVLENAPWWTPTHAAWVVALLVLAVLAMFGWLAVMGRQASLRELTVSDPLTGLYNRRGFLLLAEQQWRLALRGKMSFLLFYIDVDRFKEINDSLGHKEGDLALQAVAEVLRECFRKADILGRLGGDEFAVTAIDAPLDSRATLEERLARTVQQNNAKAGRSFQLSLSVGVLSCDKSLGDLPIEDLLAQADALMYQQKRHRKGHGI